MRQLIDKIDQRRYDTDLNQFTNQNQWRIFSYFSQSGLRLFSSSIQCTLIEDNSKLNELQLVQHCGQTDEHNPPCTIHQQNTILHYHHTNQPNYISIIIKFYNGVYQVFNIILPKEDTDDNELSDQHYCDIPYTSV